jgi:hypothetical protein
MQKVVAGHEIEVKEWTESRVGCGVDAGCHTGMALADASGIAGPTAATVDTDTRATARRATTAFAPRVRRCLVATCVLVPSVHRTNCAVDPLSTSHE